MATKKGKNFEENIKRLEEIVSNLEKGNISLENSIELFDLKEIGLVDEHNRFTPCSRSHCRRTEALALYVGYGHVHYILLHQLH